MIKTTGEKGTVPFSPVVLLEMSCFVYAIGVV